MASVLTVVLLPTKSTVLLPMLVFASKDSHVSMENVRSAQMVTSMPIKIVLLVAETMKFFKETAASVLLALDLAQTDVVLTVPLLLAVSYSMASVQYALEDKSS